MRAVERQHGILSIVDICSGEFLVRLDWLLYLSLLLPVVPSSFNGTLSGNFPITSAKCSTEKLCCTVELYPQHSAIPNGLLIGGVPVAQDICSGD